MQRLNIDAVPPEQLEYYRLDRLSLDRASVTTASLLRLDGQCALVTGGGGVGLGSATCHRLAEQGASIAVLDISMDAAAESADELAGRWGVPTLAVAADVGNWESVGAAIERVEEALGAIDIVVNNAGGSGALGPNGRPAGHRGDLLDVEVDVLQLIIQVNLIGAMLVTKSVAPRMLQRGNGRIINVASEAGLVPLPGSVVYGCAKAGLVFFTRSLARELGPAGISVAGVSPGITLSQGLVDAITDPDAELVGLEAAMSRASIGRGSVPDEVASVIAFLASPAGSYVHGTTVSVGGGISS